MTPRNSSPADPGDGRVDHADFRGPASTSATVHSSSSPKGLVAKRFVHFLEPPVEVDVERGRQRSVLARIRRESTSNKILAVFANLTIKRGRAARPIVEKAGCLRWLPRAVRSRSG